VQARPVGDQNRGGHQTAADAAQRRGERGWSDQPFSQASHRQGNGFNGNC
jgi:hypothetical protein